MSPTPARRLDARVASAFYAAVFAIAWAWRGGWQDASLVFASEADAARGLAWLRDSALGSGAAVAVIALSNLYTSRFPSGERLSRSLAALIGPLSTPACVLLALASGIAEERCFGVPCSPSSAGRWRVCFRSGAFRRRREPLPDRLCIRGRRLLGALRHHRGTAGAHRHTSSSTP